MRNLIKKKTYHGALPHCLPPMQDRCFPSIRAQLSLLYFGLCKVEIYVFVQEHCINQCSKSIHTTCPLECWWITVQDCNLNDTMLRIGSLPLLHCIHSARIAMVSTHIIVHINTTYYTFLLHENPRALHKWNLECMLHFWGWWITTWPDAYFRSWDSR